ncbi:MAG: roadblock/LC7 domain-containing protein [Candidatus Helarchaeota archaeon]|nr:roadblock/LC7 domain-containing protein [Candidatus Helarchaeota archaeon]
MDRKLNALQQMDRKIDVLQQILDDIIEESGFYGIILTSDEGLIVTHSKLLDQEVDLDSLAARAANIFNENGIGIYNPEDIIVSYPNKKIFIQKVSFSEDSTPILLLITIMPSNVRYFKRKINKIKKNLIFTHE